MVKMMSNKNTSTISLMNSKLTIDNYITNGVHGFKVKNKPPQ